MGGTVRCTWAISVRSFTTFCTGAVFAGVRGRDTRTNLDGTEWQSVTADIVVCGGVPACSDGYGGVAPKYVVRGV